MKRRILAVLFCMLASQGVLVGMDRKRADLLKGLKQKTNIHLVDELHKIFCNKLASKDVDFTSWADEVIAEFKLNFAQNNDYGILRLSGLFDHMRSSLMPSGLFLPNDAIIQIFSGAAAIVKGVNNENQVDNENERKQSGQRFDFVIGSLIGAYISEVGARRIDFSILSKLLTSFISDPNIHIFMPFDIKVNLLFFMKSMFDGEFEQVKFDSKADSKLVKLLYNSIGKYKEEKSLYGCRDKLFHEKYSKGMQFAEKLLGVCKKGSKSVLKDIDEEEENDDEEKEEEK